MARCAARTEGKPYDSVEQLIVGGYLPAGFNNRPDGSRVLLAADHAPTDSLRGARGTFLPISDVDVTRVSRTEAASYAKFTDSFDDHWGKMGPLWAAVQRTEVPGIAGREHVTITLRMTPLANKPDMLSKILGPPDGHHVMSAPGDVIAVDAVVSGQLLGMLQPGGGGSGPYHLFAGLRGGEIPAGAGQTGLIPLQLLAVFKFYIGGWPIPGAAGLLGAGLPSVTLNAEGGPMTVTSPQQEILNEVASGLKVVPAQNATALRPCRGREYVAVSANGELVWLRAGAARSRWAMSTSCNRWSRSWACNPTRQCSPPSNWPTLAWYRRSEEASSCNRAKERFPLGSPGACKTKPALGCSPRRPPASKRRRSIGSAGWSCACSASRASSSPSMPKSICSGRRRKLPRKTD